MSITNLTLRDITHENWKACFDLRIRDDQKKYVASNGYSLARAAYEPDEIWTPLGIYHDDMMVGFLMFGQPEYPELGGRVWEIFSLLVDKHHQGKGYGRAALAEAIQRLTSDADCNNIYISFHPENKVAEALYTSLGFERTGHIIDDEIVVCLPIKN